MKMTILFAFLSLATHAQENQKVMAPIHALFDGMKSGDTAVMHRTFHSQAVLHTVLTDPKTGQPILRTEAVGDFLKSVGTPHKEVYNELIWGEKIEIDGDFAQVWVNYAFYLGTAFRHCGVDAFHLIRDAKGEWKIYSLSDTRHKEGCSVPKEVSDKVK